MENNFWMFLPHLACEKQRFDLFVILKIAMFIPFFIFAFLMGRGGMHLFNFKSESNTFFSVEH